MTNKNNSGSFGSSRGLLNKIKKNIIPNKVFMIRFFVLKNSENIFYIKLKNSVHEWGYQ